MAKPAKTDRQAKIDAIRKSQKGAEKRQGFVIVGVCAAIALALIGAAVWGPVTGWLDKREYADLAVSEIGAPASACTDVTTKKADGVQDHVPDGTTVDYKTSPPAFGAHWNIAGEAPATMSRKVYTDDRPALEALVHNLEHGYTILWYDETIADDDEAMTEIRAIADKYEGTSNQRDKFIAAPWTSEDGDAFPDDAHVAFTHWSAGGQGETDTAKQVGAFQYCSGPSGAALDAFMVEYPYFDSPEPNGM